jgi:histone-lysine N-methyltransferase SETD3
LQGLRDLDRDPNLKANNKFIDWLASNGVWVQSKSSWGKAPHPLVISSNTEDDGESCGRGLLARESMAEGELMMTIPFDICLTRAAAREIFGPAIIPEYMDEYISIALLLMNERLKGSKSDWKPYLDVLPSKEDVNPSFVWTDEELESLKGSPVYMASKFLNQKVKNEYEGLKDTVFKKYSTVFPQDKFTYELFEWAFVMLFSRAARLSSKSGGEELALVPYADLMNHNPYSNTYIDAQKQGIPLISKEEEVAVYSDRSYRKFEQVFINYGEKSNADLLLLYGFALERNPFNSIDIVVGLSKDDPLYNQKKSYLDRQGRGEASVRFPLQQDRYPSELVDFLRLLLVEPEDLGLQTIANVDFNEPISPSLERRVLSTMISICETYIEQYPSTVEEDEILIKDRKMFDLLSRQQRMAVKLRASEKRILFSTITAVKEELLRLPTIVNVGEDILPAGRSFDTMGPRVPLSLNNYKSLVEDRDAKKKELEEAAKQKESSGSIAERRRRRRG